MRILTLEAGEIIMTDSAFVGGKQTGPLQWLGKLPIGDAGRDGDRQQRHVRNERIEYPTRTILRSFGYDAASRLTSFVEDWSMSRSDRKSLGR